MWKSNKRDNKHTTKMEERTTIQVSEETRKRLKILASRRDSSYEELLDDMMKVFAELDKTKTLISIPAPLAEKIKARCAGTGFNSVSEYAAYVLREVIASAGEEEKEPQKENSKSDEEKVKQRLRNLGYLD